MNTLKKILGYIWFVLGPVSIIYLIKMAIEEISRKPGTDTIIQWSVFIFVFVPISLGLMIFGYYAIKGEYQHLPENSEEL